MACLMFPCLYLNKILESIELRRLTSHNLHSAILSGNQESARAAVAWYRHLWSNTLKPDYLDLTKRTLF